SVPIPQPPSIPFIGNVTALDKDVPLHSFVLLAQTYGEIHQSSHVGTTIVNVNSYALANEVSDEKRFKKQVAGGLLEVRNLAGSGLFTAFKDEPDWLLAHRLLMPAFRPMAIKGVLEEMRDICDQMILKHSFGPNAVLDPAADFTRLTFDTIAFCSMSYRMNSFYSASPPSCRTDKPVPFVIAMSDFLAESDLRASRPRVLQVVLGKNTKYQEDIKLMRDLADQVVAERVNNPIDKKDLLNTMLHSADPQSGRKMSSESIAQNLITFLIAGHETASGMLTFTIYHLLRTPAEMRKVRAEIDQVIGDRPAQLDDLSKMPYLTTALPYSDAGTRIGLPLSKRSRRCATNCLRSTGPNVTCLAVLETQAKASSSRCLMSSW
ncbi:cytochrome P450, partial [Mycena capillaripes]